MTRFVSIKARNPMPHYIAYWKWPDYCGKDQQNAYHSKSTVVEQMKEGDVLWLFTRKPDTQTIHMVQRIVVKEKGRTASFKPRIYWVQGEGELREAATWSKNEDWLRVFDKVKTAKGTSLASNSAGELAQRFMQPRQIDLESAHALEKRWR